MTFDDGTVILFEGDSITDAGRARGAGDVAPSPNQIDTLGYGYAGKLGADILANNPGRGIQVYNRGVSGNRVTDMRDRWQSDCMDIRPDLLSILIGVNDTWHGVASGVPANGVGLKEFDVVLRKLIADTYTALPDLTLVICEPFTTEAGAVLEMNFHPDIDDRRAIVASVAEDVGAVFVPFQQMFDELCEQAPPEYWARDGVHPSPAGHEMMARFWLKTVCG